MIEMTGVESKIEGLIQVLTEDGDTHSRDLPQRQHDHAPRPPHQPRAEGAGQQVGSEWQRDRLQR